MLVDHNHGVTKSACSRIFSNAINPLNYSNIAQNADIAKCGKSHSWPWRVRFFAYALRIMHWRSIWNRENRFRSIAAIIALLAFGGAIMVADGFAERRAIGTEQSRLSGVARLSASSYQRQVDKFRLVATTLSADSDVGLLLDRQSPSAANRLNGRLANLSEALDASVIYLMNRNGTTIASSNWRQPDSFLDENYRFRAYFTKALATGQWEQYALGTRSRIPGLFVARRVITGNGSIGVIVVKIRFDRLEQEWATGVETTFVTNQQGVILVSSEPAWRFQTIRQLGEAEQRGLRERVEFGDRPLQQNSLFAGQAVISRPEDFSRAARYVMAKEPLANGWAVHVLAPIDAPVGTARTLSRLAMLVMGGLILSLVLFYIVRRRAIIAGEQRENAVRIADLKDRLVQANKLSSLGQMAAGIGHEINQPLTAIALKAKNASKLIDTGRADEAITALSDISVLTARMGAITGELRNFAKRGDGKIGPVSLRAAVEGTLLLLGDRIRTTGTTLVIGTIDFDVIGQQGKLEQVFVNLIQNALDAMGSGGRIDIAARLSGEMVAIAVKDTGPGIAADVLDRLFHPFVTSKSDGLGLGLVICHDIVTGFGGELKFTPVRTGSEFVVTLKAAA